VKIATLTLPSFAKINWNLRILGKRPDGYHEVRTVLQSVSLRDELTFELDEHITLTCTDPEIPTDSTNLVVRAADALQERAGTKGAKIELKKTIPTKAGLGGASSNAAVALVALNRLWQLDLSQAELLEIAARLGADVPFFLTGGTALGTGKGSMITPLSDVERKHLVIISPHASVSTAEAYSALSLPALTDSDHDSILAVSQREPVSRDSHQWDLNDELVNDFEPVIFEREPEIERAKHALLEAGACGAMLAGSGSSVFGIFDDTDAQLSALKSIKTEVGWRLFPCVTISRVEYTEALSGSVNLGSF
jgi:4-diphosphocytidyl-2-C-methyl-D-erythritol kinase